MKKNKSMAVQEQLPPSPANGQSVEVEEATPVEAATQAESATPEDKVQTEDDALKDFSELQDTVHEHEKSGLKAGEALGIIKKDKLYRKCPEYAGCTWKEYTLQEFGFTPQYANRLIYAWHAYDSTKKQFESENRSEEFEKLPKTAAFWVQYSRFPQKVQESVLNDLFDDNNELKSDWKQRYYDAIKKQTAHGVKEKSDKSQNSEHGSAEEQEDGTAEEQDNQEEGSSSKERITKLAKEIIQVISDDGDLITELSNFPKNDMESLVEALLHESATFTMNNQEEEAE